jgi:RND family efflux transporter MFP subunit
VGAASAKIELDRMERLLAKNAVERAQYDRVKAQYDAAQSGAAQAQVAVSLARRGLGDATVRAPISGVVTKVPKNPGEMATMMPPTVVVIIEDQSKLKLKFRMPESSLATLQVGDKVKANLESMGEVREATIAQIAPTVDPRTRTVEYQAILDNPDRRLKSGMLATVTIGETGEEPADAAKPADAGKPTGAVVEPAK